MQLNPKTNFTSGPASLRQDISSAIEAKLAVAENGVMENWRLAGLPCTVQVPYT